LKKMLTAFVILLCLAMPLSFLVIYTGFVTTGVSPTLTVTFQGLSGQSYYATAIFPVRSTDYYYMLEDVGPDHYPGDDEYEAFCRFLEHEDADGYNSSSL